MSLMEELRLKNLEAAVRKIAGFIKDNLKKSEKEGVILGLSGGIDSAVSAFLCKKALGKEKVYLLFMPERDTSPKTEEDAQLVADSLGIKLHKKSITPILRKMGIYKLQPRTFGIIPRKIQERYAIDKYMRFHDNETTTYVKNLKGGIENDELRKGIAYYRSKHRVRMIMWYFYAEQKNYLVVGNCNKTEKLIGYYVKYGDSGSDIDIIASLYKTQVKELARFLKVPKRIIDKAPSPDLVPGLTDEFALQMKYETLDQILYGLEKGMSDKEIESNVGIEKDKIEYVQLLVKISKSMRTLPPYPEI